VIHGKPVPRIGHKTGLQTSVSCNSDYENWNNASELDALKQFDAEMRLLGRNEVHEVPADQRF
jgi:hypothetical protein